MSPLRRPGRPPPPKKGGATPDATELVSLLTATLESTADGILVVDTQGRIARMNRKFSELWRIPESVLAQRDDAKALEFVLSQLENPESFLQKVYYLYEHPDAESFDVLHFRDGREFERYSLPQRVGGVTVGRVWSFRDVSERRRLEGELRQSHKMEAIGLLAGGIAHDFNNLLTVIRTHAELLAGSLDAGDDRHADVREVISAADRASALTRQLLAFGRKQILQTAVFDLGHVVSDIEPMLRRLIGEDIVVVTETSTEGTLVLADRGQMEQVIVNLAINARDAMPGGGRLTIATHLATVAEGDRASQRGAIPPGSYVCLTVTDTGVGIPRDQLARVFEPFFTTKEIGKGTGLGLATLYGIVAQLEGHIFVASEERAGSAFTIYLPQAKGIAAETAPPRADTAPARGTETILVAEDEDALRALLTRILSAQGYRVLEARNGVEALSVAAAHTGPIEGLVSDMVMPKTGGRQLSEQLRAMRPDLRVLFISGYTDDEIGRRGALPVSASFLEKPFTVTALLKALRAVLDG